MEFRFDYLKCQECGKTDFCRRCEGFLMEELLLEPDIDRVSLQMERSILSLSSGLELPALEALLKKHGIFVR